MRLPLVALVLGATLACSSTESGTPPGPSPNPGTLPRLLVVSHSTGFRHDSIPAAETALSALAASSGLFHVDFCRTAGDVSTMMAPAGLAGYQGVVFANTTGQLGIPDMGAFLGWIAAGHAFIGTHSASDTNRGFPDYLAMLGAEQETHGSIVEGDVRVDEPAHPAVAHLAPRFRVTDEWYRFRLIGSGRQVLLSMDRNPPDGVGVAGEPSNLPLAWTKEFGTGRVFYTALGHQAEIWDDPRYRRHILEGIRWGLGR
jgi:type 1 glutamine amidotransferase